MSPESVALLGFLTAAAGSIGGIGGAVLLVPALVLGGLAPSEAAPLGLLSVAAGSLSAAASQIDEGLVNHRLGVTLELPTSAAAAVGALLLGVVPERALRVILGLLAMVGAAAMARTAGAGAATAPAGFAAETSGEWPGVLGGTIRDRDAVLAYEARRLPTGLTLASLAGLVAGLSGIGGGFIKTPTMVAIMGVPVKVAAATGLFMVGITAASGLAVHLARGALDTHLGAAVVLGALVGGMAGAWLQRHAGTRAATSILAVLLTLAGLALVGRA